MNKKCKLQAVDRSVKAVVRLSYATKCRNAGRYKGKTLPKCGCDICALKYRIEQIADQLNGDGWI